MIQWIQFTASALSAPSGAIQARFPTKPANPLAKSRGSRRPPHAAGIPGKSASARLLPPHPQLQFLARRINLLINSVSRPSQNPRPVAFPHPLRLAEGPIISLPFARIIEFLRRAIFPFSPPNRSSSSVPEPRLESRHLYSGHCMASSAMLFPESGRAPVLNDSGRSVSRPH